MNTPDPPHGTLNSCFGVFCTIWVHLVPFSYLTKLGAKRAKVLQKFVPRSRVGFRHKRTRSVPLDPNLMFRCVSYYLGAFGTVWLPYETRYKMGRTSAKVRATKSRRNFSQRTHPIHPIAKLMFWCVSYYLGAFGTVWLPYVLGAKRDQLVQKFGHEVASEFFATNAPDPPHQTLN